MEYDRVNLGRDWPFKIDDFAMVRNYFLRTSRTGWVFWESEDEQPSQALIDYLAILAPNFPFYAIRRINLRNGRYVQAENPDFSGHLVSKKVHYEGRLHERIVPRRPCGWIDYPIIHNQSNVDRYDSGWKATPAYRPVLAFKRSLDILRGR